MSLVFMCEPEKHYAAACVHMRNAGKFSLRARFEGQQARSLRSRAHDLKIIVVHPLKLTVRGVPVELYLIIARDKNP